ncbi:MAG: MFS transporter [Anaerolineales bacterium]|nr:MFS transporter [Anaerolineales bacterium]
MTAVKQGMTVREILAVANYRWLWLGQTVSEFGDALTHLALILLINRVTDGDTSAIAYLLIALAIPRATLGLLAGVFVDRWDRKRIMQVSDLSRAVLVLGFILVATTDNAQLGWIYALAFVHSVMGTFFNPARSAIIPNILPEKGLLAANSLSQISFVLFRVLGASAAGILVGQANAFSLIYLVDAITFVFSFIFISRIALTGRQVTAPAALDSQPARQILGQIREGIGVIFASRVLVGTIVGAGMTMLGLGAVNILMAPFIVNNLAVSETWFGAIEAVQVAGMIISGALVAVLAARLLPTHIVALGLIGVGGGIGLTFLVPNIWWLFPLLFTVGLFITPLNASISTLFQTEVADEQRGRTGAALSAMMELAGLISMFLAGTVAAAIGVRNVFALSGALTILAGIAAWLIFRGYRPVPREEVIEPELTM